MLDYIAVVCGICADNIATSVSFRRPRSEEVTVSAKYFRALSIVRSAFRLFLICADSYMLTLILYLTFAYKIGRPAVILELWPH